MYFSKAKCIESREPGSKGFFLFFFRLKRNHREKKVMQCPFHFSVDMACRVIIAGICLAG